MLVHLNLANRRKLFGSLLRSRHSSAWNLKDVSFLEYAGTEMVDLFVGPDKKLIRVHKDLLRKKIPYFDKMFDGPWIESANNSATFPEDTVESFDLLVGWVYSGSLRPLQEDTKVNDRLGWDTFDLYVLCEKFCLVEVMDEIMDAVRTYERTRGLFMGVKEMVMAYVMSQDGSKYRLYALNSLLHVFSRRGFEEEWKTPEISRAMKNEVLCKDFLEALRDQVCAGIRAEDPRFGNNCVYHTHNPDEECTQKQIEYNKRKATTDP
ncbi:hypothetical protein EAE96_003918 [Botrytis aclada]|nr:hypothetical protein EAE96_003918 [Botrytis aclada]